MKITKTLYVQSRVAWRAWLRANHRKAQEIWLIYYKKNSGRKRIPYNDAVEEALCYGWIDSIIKSIDDKKFAQRFTPRKRGSQWSAANKERVRRLVKQGRMTTAGLAAYRDRTGSDRQPSKSLRVPADILNALKKNKQAWNHFRRFPSSYRRVRIGWIDASRKRHDIFRQRLSYFIRMTAKGKQFGMVR